MVSTLAPSLRHSLDAVGDISGRDVGIPHGGRDLRMVQRLLDDLEPGRGGLGLYRVQELGREVVAKVVVPEPVRPFHRKVSLLAHVVPDTAQTVLGDRITLAPDIGVASRRRHCSAHCRTMR